MATETFAEAIAISGTPGGTLTLDANPAGVRASLTEADGAIDGQTVIGDQVTYGFPGFPAFDQTVTLVALTPEGPVVQFADLSLNLLTNNSGLTSGAMISSSSSGTYFFCFAEGTLIATPAGEHAVETLQIGDEILNSAGKAVPVKWIGRQTIATRFHPAERLRPVRFAIGSLGDGLPHSDLTVTADHAMLVDGVLCNASALVNGSTITRVPLEEMGDSYTVYHIETEAHEIILANGAATETYFDHASRRVFYNYAEYEALYGEEAEMQELPLPRVTTSRQLPLHIQRQLRVLPAA